MARRHVWLEVVQHCNERCAFCYNVWKADRAYPAARRDPERLRAVLDAALVRLAPGALTFSGGEPLLRRDLEGLVAVATRAVPEVQIATNGTLLDRARAAALAAAGARAVSVPLLAGEPGLHDRMTGLSGSFRRACRGLAEARRAGMRTAVVFVATAQNLHALRDAAETGIALGARCLELVRFLPGGASLGNLPSFLLAPGQIRTMLAEGDRIACDYGITTVCAEPVPARLCEGLALRRTRLAGCGAGAERLAIDPAGNVRPCEQDGRILGNVLDPAFAPPAPSGCLARSCAVENHHLGGQARRAS